MLTREQQKEIGIKRLQQLDIYTPYVKAFQKKGTVTMFENFGGYWATADNGEGELEAKIKEFEADTGDLVYAVTHEFPEFGECYSFLYVSQDEDPADALIYREGNVFYAYAWVWNKSDECCSELGSIGIQSMGGGIRRCA